MRKTPAWERPVAVSFVLLLVAVPAPVHAWNYYLTGFGEPVHWPACTAEIPFWVDAGEIEEIESDGEHQAIAEAFALWNEVACAPIELTVAGYKPDPVVEWVEGVTQNVVVFVNSGWSVDPLKQTYVALTTLSYNPTTGEIVDADLAFNAEHFEFSLCGAGQEDSSAQDFRYVALHEAGHIFGLNHSNDPLSILFVQDSTCIDGPGHYLTPDDEEGLCFYYGDPQNLTSCAEGGDAEPVQADSTPEPGVETAQPPADSAPDEDGKKAPDCGCRTGTGRATFPAAGLLPLLLLAGLLATLKTRYRGNP